MWKKDETADEMPDPRSEMNPRRERPITATPSKGQSATIGRSITIRGEVTGDEDLMIQGRVEGSVNLKQHAVTVGPDGEVKADVAARVVTVEGKVEGNVSADEQVVLRTSASVKGDISAPRLVLEDGARFRGGVDMGEGASRNARPADSLPSGQSKSAPEPMKKSESIGSSSQNDGKEKEKSQTAAPAKVTT